MVEVLVDFKDEEQLYYRIETDLDNVEKIKKILNEFRNQDRENGHSIDDFLYVLEQKGIKFKSIPHEPDVEIYF